jgi:hypothetical protein
VRQGARRASGRNRAVLTRQSGSGAA